MRLAFAALLALIPAGARAEQLVFDHVAHPALHAVVMSGREDAVYFEDRRPDHVLDRIVIRGRSPQDWDEALEILVKPHTPGQTGAQAWFDQWRASEDQACRSDWQVIAADQHSITFTRAAAQCPELAGQERIYRAMIGKKDAFVLGGFVRGVMPGEQRQQWLALFATARLKG